MDLRGILTNVELNNLKFVSEAHKSTVNFSLIGVIFTDVQLYLIVISLDLREIWSKDKILRDGD